MAGTELAHISEINILHFTVFHFFDIGDCV